MDPKKNQPNLNIIQFEPSKLYHHVQAPILLHVEPPLTVRQLPAGDRHVHHVLFHPISAVQAWQLTPLPNISSKSLTKLILQPDDCFRALVVTD